MHRENCYMLMNVDITIRTTYANFMRIILLNILLHIASPSAAQTLQAPLVGPVARQVHTPSLDTTPSTSSAAINFGARPLGLPDTKHTTGSELGSTRTSGTAPSNFRTYSSLGVVLLFALILAHVARRIQKKNNSLNALGSTRSPAGVLEVLGRYPIGCGNTLMLLKIDRRILLLSQSSSGARSIRRGTAASLVTLCEITDAEEVASLLAKSRDADGESIAAKFRDLVQCHTNTNAIDPLPASCTLSHAQPDTDLAPEIVSVPPYISVRYGSATSRSSSKTSPLEAHA